MLGQSKFLKNHAQFLPSICLIWPLCGVFSRQVPQLEHPADADAAPRDVAAVDVAQAPAASQEVTSPYDEAMFLNDRAILRKPFR